MMKNYILIFLVFLFFSSCKRNNSLDLDAFFPMEYIELSSQPVPIDPDDIDNPVLLVCDGQNIICTNHNTEKVITVYDRITGKRINDLIYNGRGPLEIMGATSIWIENDSLNVYSRNSRKIIRISLNSLTEPNPQMISTEVTSAGSPLLPVNTIYYVSNNEISSENTDTFSFQHQFILLDNNFDPLYSFEDYPETTTLELTTEAVIAYQGQLESIPNMNSFIFGSYRGFILYFYILDDQQNVTKINEYLIDLPKYNSISDPAIKMFSVTWDKDCTRGVRTITSSHDSYYVLCDPTSKMGDPEWMADKMYRFDIYGNPLEKYKLDHKVAYITFDRQNETLIAYTEDNGGMFLSYPLQ